MSEQVPIPDQLIRIRGKIALLQVEEKVLRDILIRGPSARLGGEYLADVREITSYRVSGKALEKADPELFAKLATESTVKQVWVVKREKSS